MNKIIKKIIIEDSVYFILQTEGDSEFWYWEVSLDSVEKYSGTDEEYVNDEENSTSGCAMASFKTVEEAEKDIKAFQ